MILEIGSSNPICVLLFCVGCKYVSNISVNHCISLGDGDRALEILDDIQTRVPGSLEAWMQAAGVERRRGNMEATKEVFDRCLAICQEREDKNAHSHVSLKYARFHTLVSVFSFYIFYFNLLLAV